MADRRRSMFEIEKELFPNCIQAHQTYTNKRKSTITPYSEKVVKEIHFPGEVTGPLKEQKHSYPKMKTVNDWLDKSANIKSPMTRARRPFSDIDTNINTAYRPKTAKKRTRFDSENKKTRKKKSFKTAKKHLDQKTKLNILNYSIKSPKKSSEKPESENEEVVIEDSQMHEQTDKDAAALKEVERLSKMMECCENIDYSNEVDNVGKEPLAHFPPENGDIIVRNIQNSKTKHQSSLKNSGESRNNFYSEEELIENIEQNHDIKLSDVPEEEHGSKQVPKKTIKVPFFKLGKLVHTRKRKQDKQRNDDEVAITVSNKTLMVKIEIVRNEEDIKVTRINKIEKGIQTDELRKKDSEIVPQTDKIEHETPRIEQESENLFPQEKLTSFCRAKNVMKSLSISSTEETEDLCMSGRSHIITAEIHASPGSIIDDSCSDNSIVEATPFINRSTEISVLQPVRYVNGVSSLRNKSKPLKFDEPCFRRLSGGCLSTCSSDKENNFPNIQIEEDKTCEDGKSKKRKVFGVLSEHKSEPLSIYYCLANMNEINNVKVLCDKFGWHFVEHYDDSVTHVIATVDDFNMTQRSIPYLKALAAGKWILSYQWIVECLEQDCHIEETEFEVLDANGNPSPRASRLAQLRLFSEMKFFCMPPFSSIDTDSLKSILRSAGADVVDDLRDIKVEQYGPPSLLLADAPRSGLRKFKDLAQRSGVVSVNYEWALDCLCSYELFTVRDKLLCSQNDVKWETLNWPPKMIESPYNFRSLSQKSC